MEITPFNFNGAELRCITKESEPWFVAADVCKVLEINNPTDALSRLDEDEKNTLVLNEGIQRGNPNVNIINESGLYSLTLTSRKPQAKAFKKWVTSVVLPAIRKTGGYSAAPVMQPISRLEMAKMLLDAETRAVELETKLIEAAPKVEFHDTVTASNDVVPMATAAAVAKLPYGNVTLFRKLREKGVLMSGGQRHNLPKQRFIDQGLFTVDEFKFEHNSGEAGVRFTTHVTQKGIAWIVKEFSHETAEKGVA